MRDKPPTPTPAEGDQPQITTQVPQPARLQNYLAGGDANFAVDRELADYLGSKTDLATARAAAHALEAFMLRAVRYLAVEAGVRQFLVVGATIPTIDAVHDVAQQAAPEARVVYVGRDPVVAAHAHTLRRSTPEGATAYIQGSVRNPQNILQQAADTLDLAQPVALVLVGILAFVRDEDDPHGLVARLLKGVPSGSFLVVAHPTTETQTELALEVGKRITEQMQRPFVQRSRAQVARFFDGLDLVEEGQVVQIDQWRRHENQPIPNAQELIPIYGGVGRKS